MFESFKFKGMQYLAVTALAGYVQIASYSGSYHGHYASIRCFKNAHRKEDPAPLFDVKLKLTPIKEVES